MHMFDNQLATLATLLQDRLEQAFEGLSPSAAAILMSLRNRKVLAISRLAEIIGISQPTTTRLIDGLERNSLVTRRPRDGRVVAVALTARGRKTAKRLQAAREKQVEDLLSPLGKNEERQLAKLVDRLLFSATKSREAARTTCRYCDHENCSGRACPVNRRATEIETEQAASHQARGDDHAFETPGHRA